MPTGKVSAINCHDWSVLLEMKSHENDLVQLSEKLIHELCELSESVSVDVSSPVALSFERGEESRYR